MFRKQIMFVAAACLAVTMGSAAVQAEGVWTKDQNGCAHWNEEPEEGDSVTWSGGCKDGKADGEGELLVYSNGEEQAKYVGQLMGGKRHGQGTTWYGDGSVHKGMYANGEENGQGTVTQQDGSTFTGEFRGGGVWTGAYYDATNGEKGQITEGKMPDGSDAE